MEPRFQSSFIPKGPVSTAGPLSDTQVHQKTTFFGLVATVLFIVSLVLAAGSFGYDRYLLAHIGTLGTDLASARATMQPDTINELVRANQRIISTKSLLTTHTALSPFFDYLELSTLKNVRFTQFLYQVTDNGLALTMHGQAKSYTDVALQSDAFNKAGFFKGPVFSDLDLDAKGNVIFTFKATLDPSIVSYKKRLEGVIIPAVTTASTTPAALQATTTQKTVTPVVKTTATTTQKTATTTPH
ncbi:MAG: protein of unknown function with transrane region [Parcubacteria group bacterium]|nr:protein of unknown function with transrane region [Parcubacteria group bacterium]